jgi:hypothetical protein
MIHCSIYAANDMARHAFAGDFISRVKPYGFLKVVSRAPAIPGEKKINQPNQALNSAWTNGHQCPNLWA